MGEVCADKSSSVGTVSKWAVLTGVVVLQVMMQVEVDSAKKRIEKLEGEMHMIYDFKNKVQFALAFKFVNRSWCSGQSLQF